MRCPFPSPTLSLIYFSFVKSYFQTGKGKIYKTEAAFKSRKTCQIAICETLSMNTYMKHKRR